MTDEPIPSRVFISKADGTVQDTLTTGEGISKLRGVVAFSVTRPRQDGTWGVDFYVVDTDIMGIQPSPFLTEVLDSGALSVSAGDYFRRVYASHAWQTFDTITSDWEPPED